MFERLILHLARVSSSPGRKPGVAGRAVTVGGLLLLVLLPAVWGCDDDPFKVRWQENPDTVLLYSLARPELNLNSAFDFVRRVPVRIESPTAGDDWDLAVDTRDGELVLVPPRVLGLNSLARIAVMEGLSFFDVTRAPSDTAAYISEEPVPFEFGNTYVIQTRQELGSFGRRCVYYGKLEPVAKDLDVGSVTFMYDVSPVCNNRKLIPPED